jgi:hypothetical protein
MMMIFQWINENQNQRKASQIHLLNRWTKHGVNQGAV